jgi:hypothetical protein
MIPEPGGLPGPGWEIRAPERVGTFDSKVGFNERWQVRPMGGTGRGVRVGRSARQSLRERDRCRERGKQR